MICKAWFGVCTLECQPLKPKMQGWQSGHSVPTGGLFVFISACWNCIVLSFQRKRLLPHSYFLEPLRDLFYLMPENGGLDWKAAVFSKKDGCVQLSSSCGGGNLVYSIDLGFGLHNSLDFWLARAYQHSFFQEPPVFKSGLSLIILSPYVRDVRDSWWRRLCPLCAANS